MVSSDARAQMLYDAQKKYVFLAYVMWFFLWGISMHRLYVHKWFSALIQVGLGVTGMGLLMTAGTVGAGNLVITGIGLLALWGLSFFIDMFRIPGWIHRYNVRLVDRV